MGVHMPRNNVEKLSLCPILATLRLAGFGLVRCLPPYVWQSCAKRSTTPSSPQLFPASPTSSTRSPMLGELFCPGKVALEDQIADTACSWYGSGYLLPACAFQLSYGKLYNLFPIKWVFLLALGLFELGSLVCGAAPTSVGLILGRVVAGIGTGGIFSGVSTVVVRLRCCRLILIVKATLVIASSIPLNERPIYNGILGAMSVFAYRLNFADSYFNTCMLSLVS